MNLRPVIVLTRETQDNKQLSLALSDCKIPVLEIPCIETQYQELAHFPCDLQALAFTSRRGVEGLMHCELAVRVLKSPSRPMLAAVGNATALALASYGFHAELIADPPQGDLLAQRLMAFLSPFSRIALVQGDIRAGVIEEILAARGLVLFPICVYKNIEPIIPVIAPRRVAAIFLASPSAGKRLFLANPWMRQCKTICIGNTTALALQALLSSEAPPPQIVGPRFENWIKALCTAYKQTRNKGVYDESVP